MARLFILLIFCVNLAISKEKEPQFGVLEFSITLNEAEQNKQNNEGQHKVKNIQHTLGLASKKITIDDDIECNIESLEKELQAKIFKNSDIDYTRKLTCFWGREETYKNGKVQYISTAGTVFQCLKNKKSNGVLSFSKLISYKTKLQSETKELVTKFVQINFRCN